MIRRDRALFRFAVPLSIVVVTMASGVGHSHAQPPGVLSIPAEGGVVAGSTSGSSNYSASCGTGSVRAPEQVFEWIPDVSGTVTMETCGPNTAFDTVLYARSGSLSGSGLACSDDVSGCAVNSGSRNSGRHGSRISFDVTAGQKYYIFVDGYEPSSGASEGDFELTVTPPLASSCGDGVVNGSEQCDGPDASACSTGQCYDPDSTSGQPCTCVPPTSSSNIPPPGGIVSGFTSGASFESGSCGAGSVNAPEQVFSWTPDFSGQATIETCSFITEFDTVVYVRQDSPTGSEIACDDDTPGCAVSSGSANSNRHGSRVSVTVTAGETYYVFVDGYSPSSGTSEGAFELAVTQSGGGGGGDLPDLASLVSDVQIRLDTTVPAADLLEGCASAQSGVDLVRFAGTTINLGPADLVVGNPGCPDCEDNPLAVCANPNFICAPADGHGHGHYQNFAAYELLDETAQNVVAVGHKQGFCLRDTSCTFGSPTYDCTFQGLTAGCSDLYWASLGCQYIDITNVPGGNYFVRMTADPLNLVEEADETNNAHMVPVTIPDRGNVRPVAQPDSATTPEDTPITIDVLSNDSDPDGFLDPASVNVAVGASNGSTSVSSSDGMITYTPNPSFSGGDAFTYEVSDNEGSTDAAVVTITVGTSSEPQIPPGGGVVAGFTSGTSSHSGTCASASGRAPEQVFTWVPDVSGTATLETCGLNTEFDTVLYVRDGGIAGTELGCSDDVNGCGVSSGSSNSGRHGSRVVFNVVAGQTYYVIVDAYRPSSGASEGNFELTVIPAAP